MILTELQKEMFHEMRRRGGSEQNSPVLCAMMDTEEKQREMLTYLEKHEKVDARELTRAAIEIAKK